MQSFKIPPVHVCPTCGSSVERQTLSDHEEISEAMVRLGLRRSAAILFLMLWRSNGRIVTYQAFLDLQNALIGRDCGHYRAVASIKKRLKKALKDYPVEIKSAYGLGYHLKKLDPDWDWRNETID